MNYQFVLRSLLAIATMFAYSQAHSIVIRADGADADHLALGASFGAAGAWRTGSTTCSATVVEISGTTGFALTSTACASGLSGGLLGDFFLGSSIGSPTSTHSVFQVDIHPDFDSSSDRDLAVIQFGGASASTPIASIYTGSSQVGQTGTLVGYGSTGTGLTGGVTLDAFKRAATNEIDAKGSGDLTLLLDFDDPADLTASSLGSAVLLLLEGISCLGDIGGGLFADIGAGQQLVGVISRVSNDGGGPICGYGATSMSVSLVENLDFLNDAIYGGSQILQPIVSKVPEPSTLGLLGAGLLGLFVRRKRVA